jgi:Flp pilus assembly pilin Flp
VIRHYLAPTESLKRLCEDKDGMVSFEYIIVAACVIAAVIAAFGTDATTGIGAALSTGIGKITTAITSITFTT